MVARLEENLEPALRKVILFFVFSLLYYSLFSFIVLVLKSYNNCHCNSKVSDEFTDAFDTLADRFGSGPMFQFTSSLGGNVDTPLIEQVVNYRIQYFRNF